MPATIMSAIPSSSKNDAVSTAADRRSKRPTKKRALTPVSAQAAGLDALFAKPEQEIRLPALSHEVAQRQIAAASGSGALVAGGGGGVEIISNVQGSSSGAGSGEFHVYKASRRREYARLRQLDEEALRDREAAEFAEARRQNEARDDEKTRRNREKREKAKARKAAKTKGGKGGGGGAKEVKAAVVAKAPTSTPAKEDEPLDREDDVAGTTTAPSPPTTDVLDTKPTVTPLTTTITTTTTAIPIPILPADAPGLLIQDDDDDGDD